MPQRGSCKKNDEAGNSEEQLPITTQEANCQSENSLAFDARDVSTWMERPKHGRDLPRFLASNEIERNMSSFAVAGEDLGPTDPSQELSRATSIVPSLVETFDMSVEMLDEMFQQHEYDENGSFSRSRAQPGLPLEIPARYHVWSELDHALDLSCWMDRPIGYAWIHDDVDAVTDPIRRLDTSNESSQIDTQLRSAKEDQADADLLATQSPASLPCDVDRLRDNVGGITFWERREHCPGALALDGADLDAVDLDENISILPHDQLGTIGGLD